MGYRDIFHYQPNNIIILDDKNKRGPIHSVEVPDDPDEAGMSSGTVWKRKAAVIKTRFLVLMIHQPGNILIKNHFIKNGFT